MLQPALPALRRSVFLLALGSLPTLAVTASAIHAQQPAAPAPDASQKPYTLSVKSQLVVLDVVVTDTKGNVVPNLTKEDFEVLEDKQPQTIKSFERPETHVLPTNLKINSTAELDREAPDSPVSIIVLDEMNTRFEDMAFARYSLKKYLNSKGDTLDQPTMLAAIDLQGFNVLRDYTNSKKDILNALDHHLGQYPWHLTTGGAAGDWTGTIFSRSFNALTQVAEATAGHPGHKNMIWVGRGFPSLDTSLLDADDQTALKDAITRCVNRLRDSRITLYTVDPSGVAGAYREIDPEGDTYDDPFTGSFSFGTIAASTGGRPFYGRNDVDNLISTSVRNGQEFYTLSYTPSNPREDVVLKPGDDPDKNFHKIQIVMKNPAYKAVSRAGYYPPTPPPATHTLDGKPSEDLLADVTTAAYSMMVYDGIPMTVTRDPASPDLFNIHVDSSAMEWVDNGPDKERTCEIAIALLSFDRKGKPMEKRALNVIAKAPAMKEGATTEARALNIHAKIKTAEPVARIRFVVRVASTGKVGAQNFLLVDAKELKTPTSYTPRSDKLSQRKK